VDNNLFTVFVFLAAACLVVPLASRFKLGSVLGYLAAGIVIGPFGLGLIGDAEKIMHFAEFGVVMMLFVIGLELEPALLWRLRKSILGLGGLQVALTSTAFTLIGLALGYSWQMSLTAGMALSLSSTALVLQMLQETHLMNTSMGETSFSVLLFQDIAVIHPYSCHHTFAGDSWCPGPANPCQSDFHLTGMDTSIDFYFSRHGYGFSFIRRIAAASSTGRHCADDRQGIDFVYAR